MRNMEELVFEARRYARREKFTHALKLFQQVLDVDPNNLDALIGKGGCHYKLGHDIWARITWEQVLQVDPKNKKVKEFLRRIGDDEFAPKKKRSAKPARPAPSKKAPAFFMLRPPKGVAALLTVLLAFMLMTASYLVRDLRRTAHELPKELACGASVVETFDRNASHFLP